MRQFIDDYRWFAVNAVLVAGLVALGSALSGHTAGGSGAPAQPTQAEANRAVQVVLGAASSTTIKQAAAPAPAPAPQPRQNARPRIIGGELEDDD